MPKKRSTTVKETNIKIGNVSNVSGNVNIAGGNVTAYHITTCLSVDEIKSLFDGLYAQIETRPETFTTDKEDLKAEVKEIQTTVTEASQKNEKVNERFLARRFRNIARMAPDVFDVVVAALGNPLAGLGVAVKKIAQKAKEETTKE